MCGGYSHNLEGRQLLCLHVLLSCIQNPSEKGSFLALLEKTPFQMGGKTILT